MRRHLAVAAALAVLALASGCSGDEPASGAVWETPRVSPSVSASAGVKLSADAQATCAEASRVSTEFGGTFMTDLRLRIEAKGSSARDRAQAKIDRDVNKYSSALAALSKRTADAALKKALKQMSTQVKALKGDIAKVDAKKLSTFTTSLDKACGRV